MTAFEIGFCAGGLWLFMALGAFGMGLLVVLMQVSSAPEPEQ